MSSEQPEASRQGLADGSIENWCDDPDQFGAKVGTTDGIWAWVIEKVLPGERDITFANKVDSVAQVVAHLAMPPIVMAWREAGEDESELSTIIGHFVAEWGYNERTLCSYVESLRIHSHIPMAKCAMDYRASLPGMGGDITQKILAGNLHGMFKKVLASRGVPSLSYKKLSEFMQVLEKEEDEGDRTLLIHDHTSLTNIVENHVKTTAKLLEERTSKIEADVEQRQKSLTVRFTELKADVERQLIEQHAAFAKELANITKISEDKMTRLKTTIFVFVGALAVSVLVIGVIFLLKLR